jgi:hypothetical protein
MMWVLPVTRRELVDLITPRRGRDVPGAAEEQRPSFEIVRGETMAAVWPARPADFGRLPTAIVVPEGSLRDTLAWLSTYVRDFRPFTAYCRVVERPVAEQFLRGPSTPTLSDAEGICSGLILGEALTHAGGRASAFDLPATAYSATLSHAISRALSLTGGVIALEDTAKLWSQAREVTDQNELGVSPKVILSVWSVALGNSGRPVHSRTLFEPSDILTAAWTELTSAGEIRDPVWHRLVDGFPNLEQMRSLLEMPREQRVQVIDVALRSLLPTRRGDDERRGFLAGYFTSLLAPGTLDHVDFLGPISAMLPTAFLWYGLFAGVNTRGDALPVGNPLARRIIRDLTIPDRLVDRPRCDVAVEELTMHAAAESFLRLTAKAGRLDLDILPGVTMSVRWPAHGMTNEEGVRRVRENELQRLLMELDEAGMRWRHLTERLRDLMQTGDADRQQTTKKKRGGKA